SDISVGAPTAGTSCFGGASVSPEGGCFVGLNTSADTVPGTYVFVIAPANNLLTASNTNFSVTEPSLGFFAYRLGSMPELSSLDIAIGADPVVLPLTNVGSAEATGVYLTVPEKFQVGDAETGLTCPTASGDAIALNVSESCSVTLSVADGSGAGEGSYDILVTGDMGTVSNSGATLSANVRGAHVSIQSGLAIPLPNEGSSITEVTLTNDAASLVDWIPSTDGQYYEASGFQTTGLAIVDPGTDHPYCLGGEAVAPGGSCVLGLEVGDDATVGTYVIILSLSTNLATAASEEFDITGSLGFFSFSPSSITMGIDSSTQPQSITLTNAGGATATGVFIDPPGDLTVTANNCGVDGDTMTLPVSETCTFEIAFDGSATQTQEYVVLAMADDASVENNGHPLTVTAEGVAVAVQQINEGNPISRPAVGTQITDVEIVNLGNIEWIASDDAGDYQITPAEGISLVAPSTGDSCLEGSAISPGNSCYV
ncbi:MAG: hypothetical protein KC561_18565, partial [Myxococcales bacterium]|nr:hypothetical protein [Myxococcales bacterium]